MGVGVGLNKGLVVGVGVELRNVTGVGVGVEVGVRLGLFTIAFTEDDSFWGSLEALARGIKSVRTKTQNKNCKRGSLLIDQV